MMRIELISFVKKNAANLDLELIVCRRKSD